MAEEEIVSTAPETPVEIPPQPQEEPEEKPIDTPPDPDALKAEIEKLEAVRKKAEEDAQYWRKEKARARKEYFTKEPEQAPKQPGEEQVFGKEPRKEDYEDYEKYLDDKIAFETSKARIQWDREQSRKSQETAHQQKMTRLQEKINLGFVEYPDFEEVAMNEMVPITPMVMEAMAEFDNPHKLAYYLGRNRAEAIQISRMTPVAAARALARIELEIEKAGPSPGGGSSVRNTTAAPPPIKPSGSSHAVSKDPDRMTQAEYEDWRKSQGARRF